MIDAFCHILPPKYEETRWARAGSKDFAASSPAHLQYVRTGRKAPNYEGADEPRGPLSHDGRVRGLPAGDQPREPIARAVAPRSSVELSTIANDELAELVAKYPTRFAGAAGAVPMNEPDAACREIERLFDQLRLCAVQIFTNVNGRPLDAPEFRPVWKTLADKGVPVLLHPARSSTHADYAAEQDSKYLIWQVFGWPYESTAAVARLVFSGIMQTHPGLKILVHHTAAMIPFFHGRMKSMFDQFSEDFAILTEGRLTQHPIEYFRRFYGDMGAFSPGAVNVARDFLGADHLLFGTDAPFDATGGRSSIRESIAAVKNSACTEAEQSNIFTTNVERFFNLAPTS